MSFVYRVTTSTCPGDTGNESKIAKQRSFAQTHSASGTSRNGEGAADSMASSVRPGGTTLVPGRKHGPAGVDGIRYARTLLLIDVNTAASCRHIASDI